MLAALTHSKFWSVWVVVLIGLTNLLAACGDITELPPSPKPTTQASQTAHTALSPEPFHAQASQNYLGHTAGITCLSYSPDGKVLASADKTGVIKLWEAVSGKFITELSQSTEAVYSLAFSPDGKMLASGNADFTISLWEINLAQNTFKASALLRGHTDALIKVLFSPDGQTLLSLATDRTGKLWNVATRKIVAKLDNARGAGAFSPDGKWLLTGSSTSQDAATSLVKLWEVATGSLIVAFPGGSQNLQEVSFEPDGKGFLTAFGGGVFSNSSQLIWWDISQDISNPRQVKTQTNTASLQNLARSPDGQFLIIAGTKQASSSRELSNGIALSINMVTDQNIYSSEVKLVASSTGQILQTLPSYTETVSAISFNPNGKTFAIASDDRSIKIWNMTNLNQPERVIAGTPTPRVLAVSPTGKVAAAGGLDGILRLVDPSNGNELARLPGHSGVVEAVAFSPNGKLLASGATDDTLRLWDVATQQQLAVSTEHLSWVNAVAFSPDGKLLASGSSDTTIKLWELNSPTPLKKARTTLPGTVSAIIALAFSADSKFLVSGSTYDYQTKNSLKVWEIQTEQARQLDSEIPILAVVFAPAGTALASLDNTGTVKLWEARNQTFKEISTPGKLSNGTSDPKFLASRVEYASLSFSPDGKQLLAGDYRLNSIALGLWDLDKQSTIYNSSSNLLPQLQQLNAVNFAANGAILAGYRDGSVKVQNITAFSTAPKPTASAVQVTQITPVALHAPLKPFTLQPLYTTSGGPGHSSSPSKMFFSPDSKFLYSGDGYTIKTWEMATGKELGNLPTFPGGLLALSPDGKLLAGNGPQNIIRLWKPASGELVSELHGYSSATRVATFSPDSTILATTISFIGGTSEKENKEKAVRLWRIADGKEIAQWEGLPNGSYFLAFSPNGQLLASASWDGQIRVWEIASGKVKFERAAVDQSVGLAFTPDGKNLVHLAYNGWITLWDTTDWKARQLAGHLYGGALVISPDGKSIVTGAAHSTGTTLIRFWDSMGQESHHLAAHVENVHALAISPDGQLVAAAGTTSLTKTISDSTIKIWNTTAGTERWLLKGSGSGEGVLTLSLDNQSFLSLTTADTIKRFEVASGKELASVQIPDIANSFLAVSPDNATLAAQESSNKVISFYDLANGKLKNQIYPPFKGDSRLVFSADNNLLLTLDISGVQAIIRGWNVNSPDSKTLFAWPAPPNVSTTELFKSNPDGKTLVLTTRDFANNTAHLHLLNLSDGKIIATFPAEIISKLSSTPDGKQFATVDKNNLVQLWNFDGVELKEQLHFKVTARVYSLAFTPDGRTLATVDEQGSLQLWQVSDGTLLASLVTEAIIPNELSFTGDGKYLLGGASSGRAIVWELK